MGKHVKSIGRQMAKRARAIESLMFRIVRGFANGIKNKEKPRKGRNRIVRRKQMMIKGIRCTFGTNRMMTGMKKNKLKNVLSTLAMWTNQMVVVVIL